MPNTDDRREVWRSVYVFRECPWEGTVGDSTGGCEKEPRECMGGNVPVAA